MRGFHPVIKLPADAKVLDLSRAHDADPGDSGGEFRIGRYNEKRPGIYVTPLFGGTRDNHLGIDLFAPVGTPVHAFTDGYVHLFAYNAADGDYGYTLITRHELEGGRLIYALHGHLDRRSLEGKREGDRIRGGQVIAWVGDRHENGGWPPHLHFQLSYEEPGVADMPGVVSDEDLEDALQRYPDPRIVLGPIY